MVLDLRVRRSFFQANWLFYCVECSVLLVQKQKNVLLGLGRNGTVDDGALKSVVTNTKRNQHVFYSFC